jgi:hypothetical protein
MEGGAEEPVTPASGATANPAAKLNKIPRRDF